MNCLGYYHGQMRKVLPILANRFRIRLTLTRDPGKHNGSQDRVVAEELQVTLVNF